MKTHESEDFIEKVLSHLPQDHEDRDAIAQEIRSTIAERTANGEPLWQTLDQLGDPLELAESYLQDTPLESAGFGRRVLAKLIDLSLPVLMVVAVFKWSIYSVTHAGTHSGFLSGFGLAGLFVVMGLFWALTLIYPALAEFYYERTLGKALLGLRVVRESGARVSMGQAFLRQLAWVIHGVWVIDCLFPLFTEKHQRAAELLSHTRTIRV